jgi:signal transduction histidine kinase
VAFSKDNVKQNFVLAHKKNQLLEFNSSLQKFYMVIDRNKIEQVLNNLIANAMKYSFENTKILVDVSVENRELVTKVIDEGQGIPKAELDKIFHPFQTTSVKSTANEKSTGLGLAIVKKIIESHHGSVSVESEVGKGSVFTFRLPVNTSDN